MELWQWGYVKLCSRKESNRYIHDIDDAEDSTNEDDAEDEG